MLQKVDGPLRESFPFGGVLCDDPGLGQEPLGLHEFLRHCFLINSVFTLHLNVRFQKLNDFWTTSLLYSSREA